MVKEAVYPQEYTLLLSFVDVHVSVHLQATFAESYPALQISTVVCAPQI